MISFEKAVDVIHDSIPNILIYNSGENETFFFFGIQPKRLWGTDELPSGGSSQVVWKQSGMFDLINFDLWSNEEVDRVIMNDYPTAVDYSEMAVEFAPISKEEFVELVAEEGLTRKIVGYDYGSESQIIFPRYRLSDDPHDIPTDGGTYYYDLKQGKWGWMSLLECCEYSGFKTVRFDSNYAS